MELFAFLFLALFFVFLGLMTAYYIQLLKSKEEFTKQDLISVTSILPKMLSALTAKSVILGSSVILGMSFLGWLYNLLGGLFNTHNSASFLFHSALPISIFYFVYKPLKNSIIMKFGEDSLASKVIVQQAALFFALGISQLALNFASWGANSSNSNTVPFFWVFANGIINFILAIMPLSESEQNDYENDNYNTDLEQNDKEERDTESKKNASSRKESQDTSSAIAVEMDIDSDPVPVPDEDELNV